MHGAVTGGFEGGVVDDLLGVVDQRHLPGAERERAQRKSRDQQEFGEGGAAVAGRTTASSPFKGEVRRGMGLVGCEFGCAVCCLRDDPIPTPALPLKGRE
jgi:hypothetical protein